MKINKEMYKFLKIFIIDAFVLISCFLASYTGMFKVVLYAVILGSFAFYLLTRKDEVEVCNFEIVMCLFSTFFLDLTFHYLRMDTPLELNFISEGMSIILLIKIFKRKSKYKNLLRDPFLKAITIIIFVSTITSIINLNNAIDLINGIRIYFRFIPVYIILYNNKVDYKYIYKILYVINLLFFIILSMAGVFKDLRTGIFGIVGGSAFEMFLTVCLMYMLIKYLNRETTFLNFFIFMTITVVCYAVNESKAYIFITILLTAVVAAIVNTKIVKKIIAFAILASVFLVGMSLLVKLYPKSTFLTNYKQFSSYVEDFIFGNSDQIQYKKGRVEGMFYVANLEQKDDFEKLFGVGMGKSMPLENWFYVKDKQRYQKVADFPISPIYQKYGETLGYHLSSFSSVYIDGGYFATALCIAIIIMWVYKGVYLLRKGLDTNEKFVGAISFFMALGAVYSCGYSGGLRSRGYQMIVIICIGIVQYTYKIVKDRECVSGVKWRIVWKGKY